jgi:hypothetical protein
MPLHIFLLTMILSLCTYTTDGLCKPIEITPSLCNMLKERGMILQETAANEGCHDAGNESTDPLRAKKPY